MTELLIGSSVITYHKPLTAEQAEYLRYKLSNDMAGGRAIVLPPGFAITRLPSPPMPLHVVMIGEHLFIEAGYNPIIDP